MTETLPLVDLLAEIRACSLCHDLPLGPRPVLRASAGARILIIGQAPGTRVHATGIPWNDPSGERLRAWLGVDRDTFYDEAVFAIVPMGFCYPGRGRSGDLPPRAECAPRWHREVLARLVDVGLILLVGRYAQHYYLGRTFTTVTGTVGDLDAVPAPYFPLVHPSPRNRLWLQRNPWFEDQVIPELQRRVKDVLG